MIKLKKKKKRVHCYPTRSSGFYRRRDMVFDALSDFFDVLFLVLFFWKDGD